jgi:hypothetical protein
MQSKSRNKPKKTRKKYLQGLYTYRATSCNREDQCPGPPYSAHNCTPPTLPPPPPPQCHFLPDRYHPVNAIKKVKIQMNSNL